MIDKFCVIYKLIQPWIQILCGYVMILNTSLIEFFPVLTDKGHTSTWHNKYDEIFYRIKYDIGNNDYNNDSNKK